MANSLLVAVRACFLCNGEYMRVLHAVTRDIPEIPDKSLIEMMMAIVPYVDFIQLREKSRSSKRVGLLIEQLLKNGIPAEKLIINERADIAKAFNIPRTHLTENSLPISRMIDAFPEMLFGRSFHSSQAFLQEITHYDYGYLGHIFETSEKNYAPLGIDSLSTCYQRLCAENNDQADDRLIAIGGMNSMTLPQVLSKSGGVAVMSALFPIKDHRFDVARGRAEAQQLHNILKRTEI